MDVLLISGRPVDRAAGAGAREVERIATGLAATAKRVRWLCPRPFEEGEPPNAPPGVEVEVVRTAAPPFRKVTGRLLDLATETRLTVSLRDDPPDLVHLHGYGGATSYLLSWTADRLGLPVVVVARPIAPVLCHRGTLVDWTGMPCDVWTDPHRCRRCTTIAGPDALGDIAAMAASCLRPLRGLSPFPSVVDFENRLDMIVHGLLPAARIVVEDPSAAEALAALGVPTRDLRIGVPNADDIPGWIALYGDVLAGITA